jgi:type I protein arginine methyltransferase
MRCKGPDDGGSIPPAGILAEHEEMAMTNPFDDETAEFYVLVNAEQQHSLWPAFAAVPDGWTVAAGPDGRQKCLDYIESNWVDMRPKSLADAMTADRDEPAGPGARPAGAVAKVRRVKYEAGGQAVNIAVDDAPGYGERPDLWPSVGEYSCYDSMVYYVMTHDEVRNAAFQQALLPRVPGQVVLDLGTGSDLKWALEAAGHGARRVFAIESMADSHAAAAALLASSPWADTIELLHGESFALSLPERAGVCVAEVIGSIASSEGMPAAMADARTRLLAPGAVVVPAAASTLAATVSLRAMFPGGLAFCRDALPYVQKIFDLCGRPFDLRLSVANPPTDIIMSTAEPVETFACDGSAPLSATSQTRLTITRAGETDGLLCWIRLEAGGEASTLDSLRDKTSWIPVYLPLFDEPARVAPGDVLEVDFERSVSDDRIHPDYHLQCTLRTGSAVREASVSSTHHGSALGDALVYRELFGLTGLPDAGF